MRRLPLLLAAALVSMLSSVLVLADQAPGGRSTTGAKVRLTADGQPDLQGFWTNDTYTPLERPAELAGKEFFTKDEAAAFVKSRVDRLLGQARDDVHYDDAIWQAETYSKEENRRTSLITEPRDGKLPTLTPEGQRRLARQNATQRAGSSDRADTRSLAERCISWGNVGPPMMPPTYNANLQILQARDQVILRHEMMHDVRIIYLDGRPHPPRSIQWLAGHSVGHWEGQTLVVDTTNFTERTNFRGSPQNTRQDIFASEALHVIERFTPTDDNTIHYAFTVEDPATWTRPWSGEMPIRRFEGPLYEYACHEGNYGLPNILRAARLQEGQAAATSKPGSGTR
ncbi:MAG TPA: hypothetical protein VFV95_14870 [Vicinamibacterales bacterium]|nr:hypothetical protein [Vicinamibacterales bacterium]